MVTGNDLRTSERATDIGHCPALEVRQQSCSFPRRGNEYANDDDCSRRNAGNRGRLQQNRLLENPQGLLLFGLRREILEGHVAEPDEVMAAIDSVTAEDVHRVAHDVIGSHGPNLALIGPFDDAERFEKLLTG